MKKKRLSLDCSSASPVSSSSSASSFSLVFINEAKAMISYDLLSDGLMGRFQERRKGFSWSEEEHRAFLAGLEKLGKGDWRGISRKFVFTRTPTQVASHAQKYFLRQNNSERTKRRSSLLDQGRCCQRSAQVLDSPNTNDRSLIKESRVSGHAFLIDLNCAEQQLCED